MTFPKRRKRSRMNVREDGPLRCPAHLQWVRGHRCLVESGGCAGNIEAAHIRMGLAGGMGMKPPDDRVVPLCSEHHRQQHQDGERSFWAFTGIDPLEVAARLARHSPALRKLEREKEREGG